MVGMAAMDHAHVTTACAIWQTGGSGRNTPCGRVVYYQNATTDNESDHVS